MENSDILEIHCANSEVLSDSGKYHDGVVKESQDVTDKFMWKPFLRQLLVSSTIWVCYFMCGLNMGAPTVFIPQIRQDRNFTDRIQQDMETWLSSTILYSGMLCAFVLPVLTQLASRRLTVLIIAASSFIGYIILIRSTSIRDLLISEAMFGLPIVSCNTILPIIITEYTLPRYRGILLTIKTASYYWGIWVSNVIGTIYYWKFIAYFGICCNVYVFGSLCFWFESPYWLVSKGRHEETMKSHRSIKGRGIAAENELKKLLVSQSQSDNSCCNSGLKSTNKIQKVIQTISCAEFYKPTLVSLLMITLCATSGKSACTIYSIDIIKSVTQSESTAYKGMILLDGVTVFGMYLGCIVARFVKRRTLMISCSSVSVVFMLSICIYLYFIKLGVIVENGFIILILLTFYQVSISSGPLILTTSIYGELVPMKFISYNIFAMAFYSFFLMGSVIKFSPLIYSKFGLHNAFLLYGICTGVCTYLVYKYLPETKDKTLQEIGDYFRQSNEPKK